MIKFIQCTWFIIVSKPILFFLLSGIAFGFSVKSLKWSVGFKEIDKKKYNDIYKIIRFIGSSIFLLVIIVPLYIKPYGYWLTFFYLWISFFPGHLFGRIFAEPASIFNMGKKYFLTLFIISFILFLVFLIYFLIIFPHLSVNS